MKKKSKIYLILFTLAFILILSIIPNNFNEENSSSPKIKNNVDSKEKPEFIEKEVVKTASLLDVNPIHIDGNNPLLNWITFNSTYSWCNGKGTVIDPYVIKNVKINGENSSSCILIGNSSVFFRIEGCTLYNSSVAVQEGAGITLKSTNNGTIINNNCSFNNGYGVQIFGGQRNLFHNNTIGYNNASGIDIWGSYYNNFTNNIVHYNNRGIILEAYPLYNLIFNNSINYNFQDGIGLYGTGGGMDVINSTIDSNRIIGNGEDGILAWYSINTSILRNTINDNGEEGIDLFECNETTISGNIINNNAIDSIRETTTLNTFSYWNVINQYIDPFVVDELGSGNFTWAQAASNLAWCTGKGTTTKPYLINDLIIDGEDLGSCIEIKNSNIEYFKIENCTFYNSSSTKSGIRLDNVKNGNLYNNNCSFNQKYGIYLYFCNDTIISGNTINNNSNSGISLFESYFNNISGNIANKNSISGIFLNYSRNNTIELNTCNKNLKYGLYLWRSNNNTIKFNTFNENLEYGILFFESNYNEISDNIDTINGNGLEGIRLKSSLYNTITRNVIENNPIGINLINSNNTIITNNYMNNAQDIIQADNSTDNTISGNYGPPIIVIIGDDDDDDKEKTVEIDIFFLLLIILGIIISVTGITASTTYFYMKKKQKKVLPNRKKTIQREEEVPTRKAAEKERQTKISKEIKKKKKKTPPIIAREDEVKREKEIEETKKEVTIAEKAELCQVHRGPLSGISYICPKCRTKYCLKCAKVLKNKNEGCWVCETSIEIDIDEKIETDKPKINISNLMDKIDNSNFIRLLKEDIEPEKVELFNVSNLTVLSKDFWKKIEILDLEEDEYNDFVNEMLSLTVVERDEYIDGMLKLQYEAEER